MLQRRVCSQSYPLHLQLTTTVISKEVPPPSFYDLYLLWKLKYCLCHHTYYYILLTYVSLMSYVDGIVLCVSKNIVRFKGVATNHISTIHIVFVCTWPLLFYSNTNTAFYHFLCAYAVVLNLLVSVIMYYVLYSIISYCWILFY